MEGVEQLGVAGRQEQLTPYHLHAREDLAAVGGGATSHLPGVWWEQGHLILPVALDTHHQLFLGAEHSMLYGCSDVVVTLGSSPGTHQ